MKGGKVYVMTRKEIGGSMRRLPMSALMLTVALTGLLSWYGARASAQAGTPPGEVVAAGNFIHVVSDAERSLAFYRDVMGMDVQQPAGGQAPPPGPRPFIATPQIVQLYNGGQTAQYRTATAMIAESPMRAELIEFKDVPRAPVAPRIQDPGASFLVLTVRDLDAVLARVKNSGTPTVTAGGQPVSLTRDGVRMRAILVRDPDGFFVQIVQRDPAPQTAAPLDRNVIDVGFGFTVSSTERMMSVFTEAFGFRAAHGTGHQRAGGSGADGHARRRGTGGRPRRCPVPPCRSNSSSSPRSTGSRFRSTTVDPVCWCCVCECAIPTTWCGVLRRWASRSGRRVGCRWT